MNRRFFLVSFILVLVLFTANSANAKSGIPRFTGTFLQLWDTHASWNSSQWNNLFASLRAIGVREVIIQWATPHAFTPQISTSRIDSAQTKELEATRITSALAWIHPAIPLLLQSAEKLHMHIVMGLAYDPAYWEKIKAEPDIVCDYLRKLRNASLQTARAALSLPHSKNVVSGFYIPQEIDDKSWLEPERQEALEDYLVSLRDGLKKVAPGLPVAISGFSNAFAEPAILEKFWLAVLKKSCIERILFQDGVGVNKLRIQETGLFMAAVSRAAQKAGGTLTPVVEIFRQVDGPPINAKPFRAVPASLSALQQQISIAAAQPHTGIVAFSLPEYCSPYGIKGSADLYAKYLASFSQ